MHSSQWYWNIAEEFEPQEWESYDKHQLEIEKAYNEFITEMGGDEYEIEIKLPNWSRTYVINFKTFTQYQKDNEFAAREILRKDPDGKVTTKDKPLFEKP